MERNEEELQDESEHSEQNAIDAVSFADSLSSLGCSMRQRFISIFSSAWQSVTKNEGDSNQMNFTARISNFIDKNIRLRERLTSLVDYVVPDFKPENLVFESDLLGSEVFGNQRGGSKFLDLYSEEEITSVIRNSGLGEVLSRTQFSDWYIEFDLSDCFVHYAYMRSRKLVEKEKYIGFLICQKGPFKLKSETQEDTPGQKFVHTKLPKNLNILNIRWFSLQNPYAKFSSKRPRLPGQNYPGTGLARECFKLMLMLANSKKRDGILNVPEHFHNAFLYENFMFLNPEDQGNFEKIGMDLAQDIKDRGLAAVSWAIYFGFLRCGDRQFKWGQYEQVYPLSAKLTKYFNSNEYKGKVKKTVNESEDFHILWDEAESYCLSAIINFSDEPKPDD